VRQTECDRGEHAGLSTTEQKLRQAKATRPEGEVNGEQILFIGCYELAALVSGVRNVTGQHQVRKTPSSVGDVIAYRVCCSFTIVSKNGLGQ